MANVGEVEIKLDGKSRTLVSSLRAAKKVNAAGGFMHVLAKLAGMDQDYYSLVVAAGLDKKSEEIEEAVYNTGLPNLTEDLTKFVQLLANGGRPLATAEDDKPGEA